MKIKLNGFKLEIDLSDLVDALDKEDHVKLARLVAADKQLFAAVLECVSSESRFGYYFADAEEGEWWFDGGTLLELREKLLPMMPAIARGAVEEALRQRNHAQDEKKRYYDWAWRLYHAWPDDKRYRPDWPQGYQPPGDPTPAEVEALFK